MATCTSFFANTTDLSSRLAMAPSSLVLHRNQRMTTTTHHSHAAPLRVVAMAPPKPAGKAKKVIGIIKLALEAGKATPAPPVGPALGSKGVNIMAFCKEYNAKTADKAGYVIPVEITVFDDKSFTFILKTPPASVLLLKAAGAEKGSDNPKKVKVGKVTADQVKAIATEKLQDLNCTTIESAMRIIAGTASNMGIDVDPPILQPKEKSGTLNYEQQVLYPFSANMTFSISLRDHILQCINTSRNLIILNFVSETAYPVKLFPLFGYRSSCLLSQESV